MRIEERGSAPGCETPDVVECCVDAADEDAHWLPSWAIARIPCDASEMKRGLGDSRCEGLAGV